MKFSVPFIRYGIAVSFSSRTIQAADFTTRALQGTNACIKPRINEFEPSPTGNDLANQQIEILCADTDKGNLSSFSGWIVSVESDNGSGQGTVDRATLVSGAFDSDGILVVSIPDLENPSFTLVLMEQFTGTNRITDIDTNNDGVVDNIATFVQVYDAVGVPDTTSAVPLYGKQLGGTDLPFTGPWNESGPRLVFRDRDDIDRFYVLQDPDMGVIKSVSSASGTATNLTTHYFPGQNPLTSTFGQMNPFASTSLASTRVLVTTKPVIPVDTKIHDIQGNGAISPLVGTNVSVTAVVVGDFQDFDSDGKRNLKGYFLQEEDSDADSNPATSEGIFVYDPKTIVDVAVGNLVQVYGSVSEYFGETQINAVAVSILSQNITLPTPASVSLPASQTTLSQNNKTQPDLEAYEGMLVKFVNTLTITELFQLDRFNEIKLVQGGRPHSYTQLNIPNTTGYQAHLQDVGSRLITYDDGSSVQNKLICNLDGFSIDGTCQYGSFSTKNDIRMGDTVTGLTGILYYQWAGNSASGSTWRVSSIRDGDVNFVKANPRPQAPPSFGSSHKLVSVNVLNFFRTLNRNGPPTAIGPRGANNEEELLRQKSKLVTAIIEMDPDICGMNELENEFLPGSPSNALEYLVQELNLIKGGNYFAWVDPGTEFVDASDAISNGFLYKTSLINGLAGNVAILRDDKLASIGIDDSTPIFTGTNTNGASIAASFVLSNGSCITIVLNHLKSKGGTNVGDNSDKNDGAGAWNSIRVKAAEAIHAWVGTDPTNASCQMVALMGDMNSYASEDPIKYFESVGYTDLDRKFNGDDSYSYVFDGLTGTLDYVLVNDAFLLLITGASSWHVNADEADALDYNLEFGRDQLIFDGTTPYRYSDHDSIVVGFNLVSAPTSSPVTLTPSANPTSSPSVSPSMKPSVNPTASPSVHPSIEPTANPSASPSMKPTENPTSSRKPTTNPSVSPSKKITRTRRPTKIPSSSPSQFPSKKPTKMPTSSRKPTTNPSVSPSKKPSRKPTKIPRTRMPTKIPSASPSRLPSERPTKMPTSIPTAFPSKRPTNMPRTKRPSKIPLTI